MTRGGGELTAGRNAAGWDTCLDALSAHLAGRAAEASQEQIFERIESYIELFGLAEGEVRDQPEGYLVRFGRDLVWWPAEKVWATLTETHDETGGIETGRIETGGLTVGAPPPLRFTNGYVPAGSITAVEPPLMLEYDWQHAGAPAGRVRWEITADPKLGTRLVLTQTLPSRLADLRATALAAWQTHLELFFSALNGTTRCWPAERTEELRKRYADRLG
ncbi:MAG: SRPBCC domain-containing protein [Streptomycetales bacterium]